MNINLIETYGSKEWFNTVKNRYDHATLTFNHSPEAFTLLLVRGNKNILIARYCRVSKVGVVFDRRGEVRK